MTSAKSRALAAKPLGAEIVDGDRGLGEQDEAGGAHVGEAAANEDLSTNRRFGLFGG